MPDTLFTIGHSNHPIEKLVALLRRHRVTAVCDVRSTPYSRYNPQFDRESLKCSLEASGIRLVKMWVRLQRNIDNVEKLWNLIVRVRRLYEREFSGWPGAHRPNPPATASVRQDLFTCDAVAALLERVGEADDAFKISHSDMLS